MSRIAEILNARPNEDLAYRTADLLRSGASDALAAQFDSWIMDTITGTSGDDSLEGTSGADLIEGLAGNDSIYGNGGIDTITAGSGDDYAEIGFEAFSFSGDAGDDVVKLVGVSSDAPDTFLDGGDGHDVIDSSSVFLGSFRMEFRCYDQDDEFLDSSSIYFAGNFASNFEEISGSNLGGNWFFLPDFDAPIALHGGQFEDSFFSSHDHGDVLYGYGGNDSFNLNGADTAYGGAGNDEFDLGWDGGEAHGGAGLDLLIAGFGSEVDLTAGFARGPIGPLTTISSIENVEVYAWREYGTTIIGSSAPNHFFVTDLFNDGTVGVYFSGRGGNDLLSGSKGDDTLRGDNGHDTLLGFGGRDSIFGGRGNDEIDAGTRNDTIIGGDGNDTLLGRSGHDQVFGGNDDDQIFGSDGDDSLDGGFGDDYLVGGRGDNTLFGGAGSDSASYLDANVGVTVSLAFRGTQATGWGNDLLEGVENLEGTDFGDVLSGNRFANQLAGGNGNDALVGRAGVDTLVGGNGSDTLVGNNGDDDLRGEEGDDRLNAGNGDDLLTGGDGIDTLVGNAGRDSIDGGDGDDKIYGDQAGDTLTGGAGADIFVFRGAWFFDQITDFEAGIDTINLRDLRDANGGSPITFDQLLITQAGSRTRIELDLNEDGIADQIDLDGDGNADSVRIDLLNFTATDLDTSDFVF